METKTIEIRDRMTFIAAVAVRLEPESERDRYLFARSGFGLTPAEQGEYVVLLRLSNAQSAYDPYAWGDRTMANAHRYLIENWAAVASGDVVDVEVVLGEKDTPSQREQLERDA